MITLTLVTFLFLGKSAIAQSQPKIQLAHRIEIEPNDSGARLSACDFSKCLPFGKGTYSKSELQKAALKAISIATISKEILKAAASQQRSETFALLVAPFNKDGKSTKSVLGYGGSGFAFLASLPQNGPQNEADYIYNLPAETMNDFRFFDNNSSLNQLKEELTKALH